MLPAGLCHSHVRLLSWCSAQQPASFHCSWAAVHPAECRAGVHLGSWKVLERNREMRCTVSSVKYSGVSKLMPSTSSSPGLGAGSASGDFAPSSPGLRSVSACWARVVGLEASPQGFPVLAKPGLGRRGWGWQGTAVFLFTKTEIFILSSICDIFKCQDLAFLWLSLTEFH